MNGLVDVDRTGCLFMGMRLVDVCLLACCLLLACSLDGHSTCVTARYACLSRLRAAGLLVCLVAELLATGQEWSRE